MLSEIQEIRTLFKRHIMEFSTVHQARPWFFDVPFWQDSVLEFLFELLLKICDILKNLRKYIPRLIRLRFKIGEEGGGISLCHLQICLPVTCWGFSYFLRDFKAFCQYSNLSKYFRSPTMIRPCFGLVIKVLILFLK